MRDLRAGSTGTTATADPSSSAPHPTGKRVARHAAEQRTSQPYAGRRIAQVAPAPAPAPAPASAPAPAPEIAPWPGPSGESLPYSGRRVAGRESVVTVNPSETVRVVGRRIAFDPALAGDHADVSGHLLRPAAAPSPEPYAGRRVAQSPSLAPPAPAIVLVEPSPTAAVLLSLPTVPTAAVVDQAIAAPARQIRPAGRRVASRRTRIPSLPLLAGLAVLAVSTCGALQAVNPSLAGAGDDGHLSPASALSGSSAVGSADLLGGRGAVVSRSSDRRSLSGGSSLRAAADAQAKERDQTLSAFAAKAEKRAAQIELHQWVLPVTPGVYHLTARFGDYSSLWAHFHTGLDFAAPTGTPIMAVADGTITEVGYSGAYGNRTIETLADGTELWYCHQNEFGTSVGATVKPGQVIGYVGSTGNVTGPHLHLEVHPGGGDPVDPYTALVVHGLQP
jgi:hypothetical protein